MLIIMLRLIQNNWINIINFFKILFNKSFKGDIYALDYKNIEIFQIV